MANLGPTNIEGNLVIKNQTYTPNMSSGGTSSRVVVLDDDGILRYKTNFADVNHNHDTAYLGKSAQAVDSAKLGGQLPSYYEPAFTKNTAFNKNFGTGTSDVARGDHGHSDLHSHTNKTILDSISAAFTTALKISYDGAVTNSHTHSNKTILDSISEAFTTALKANYDSAYTNSHTHSNKAILDAISASFTTALKTSYDGAVTNSHTHSNKTVLDALTQAIIDNSHTHGNKTTLDAITAAFTTALKTSYDGAVTNSHTHANKTVLDALTQAIIDNSHTHSNKAILDAISASFTTALKTSYDSAVTNSHTHANTTALNNVSGTNTGDETPTRIGTLISGATAKTTPADADMVGLMDSAASNILKKLSWVNIKATLKTYFDTLYATSAQGTKADNALPSSSYTANDVLSKILTVDGPSSGLDADKLDGKHASEFATSNHNHDGIYSTTDTTYSFATGTTNGTFNVTPSGGSATAVSIYGLGTAAYTSSGAYATSSHGHNVFSTTENGFVPKTTTSNTSDFLRRDGSWATPLDTTYTLPLASNGTRGGIQIGYTATGANLPLQLSSEKGYITLTSSSITAGLGYTPYDSTNPNGYTSNTGTVTNIATGTGLTGGPITTTGTISLATAYGDSVNPYASKTAKYILAAPNATNGVPSFRLLVASDIPTLNQNTTGSAGSVTSSITFNNGGTGATSGTTYNGSTAQTISYNTIGAAPLVHTHDYSALNHSHGNITDSGAIGTTSGLMVKTTTSGVLTTLPAGSSGQFLRYDGTWATPPDTIYTLPLASNGTKGGIQIGYTATGANLPLLLSSEKAYITLTSSSITSALGYTPYNNTNPNGYTSNTGTVTSVSTGTGLKGGPITTTGTIDLDTAYGDSVNPYGIKTAGFVLAAPTTINGVPTFRKLEPSDIPALNNSITFNNGGAGDASGTSYNSSAARTISYNTIGAVPSGRVITAGNGLTGGGDLTANRTLTLGTPGTLDNSTNNSVTSTSHTHAITFPNFYNAEHDPVPTDDFNNIWGDENNIWQCESYMFNGIYDDFGGLNSNHIGNYETSVLIQYGNIHGEKIQMLFIPSGTVANVSREGVFYRFQNSGVWMRMLDTADYDNLYNSLVYWVNTNFEPKQTTANMPSAVGGVITITDTYINKFITTPPISSGTFEINYWNSYLETEIHLTTGATVPTLSIKPGYKRVNLPGSLMPNTTYIIAIKNGVITFAKSI